ncbi:c-type cytochrome biogenesis protein CcsB [Angustibacter luteus]|uniref:C-type cytochrome biogenesis protein CcsB n=1 Tax=Angustibacter luteus TaxID=658456 RepID=A0ABW1JF17_9ACTN
MSVNETLANQANLLLYGAMAAYACAFIAYTMDLAGGAARAERIRDAARADQRELATVSAGGSSSVPEVPAAPVPERRQAAAIGTSLTILALLLHIAAVAFRGVAVHRPPWSNMFEFSVAGAAVVTLVYVLALRWRDLRYLGAFVVGPVLLTLGLAVVVLYTKAAQVVPSLKSYWLAIHVSVAFIASALLTLAFSLTVLYLAQDRRESRRAAGEPVGRSFMDALPKARELDLSSYRLHAIAFPLWTFTLVAGAIWAENAWGAYWSWDPKEVWTFVIWVVYAGYLHARATRGWQGRKAARIAIVGFGCLLFNFLVVNIFFVGFHSYAGVS